MDIWLGPDIAAALDFQNELDPKIETEYQGEKSLKEEKKRAPTSSALPGWEGFLKTVFSSTVTYIGVALHGGI